jgi:hypothetical protein
MCDLNAELEASLMVLVNALISGWELFRQRLSNAHKRRVDAELLDEFETYKSIGSSFVVVFASIIDIVYMDRGEQFLRDVERIRAE